MRALGWLVLLALPLAQAADAPPQIPLVQGLSITTAIAEAGGDYESRKHLLAREQEAWRLSYSASVPTADGGSRPLSSERIVHDADLQSARSYRSRFEEDVEEDYPGTTALGASAAVLRELKDKGSATFALIGEDHWMARALGKPGAGGVMDLASAMTANRNLSFKGTLQRRSTGTLNVQVNGQPRDLAVLVAGGRFTAKNGTAMDAELSLLDDPALPIALQWRIGDAALRVVRIDFPTPPADLAQTLKARKRATLPGLLFDFGSATLRAESQAALPAIVEAIRAAPPGALRLEGHTDNIGDAQRNQALSLARAAAVRAALVALDAGLAPRLVAQGFGASMPVASNATLEGRAQNRRVDLVIP